MQHTYYTQTKEYARDTNISRVKFALLHEAFRFLQPTHITPLQKILQHLILAASPALDYSYFQFVSLITSVFHLLQGSFLPLLPHFLSHEAMSSMSVTTNCFYSLIRLAMGQLPESAGF